MTVDLETNMALRDAVEHARAAAEADGSIHPTPGERVETTAEFRAAIEKLVDDGTYEAAVAALTATDPDVA